MAKVTRKVKNAAPKPEAAKPVAAAEVKKSMIVKPQAPKPGCVSLEFNKPDARHVFVAGSFNEWKPEQTPLVPQGNGRWAGDLSVKPGRHEYLFVVDGQWVPDPNAKETVQNPFGGQNSVLVVSS
jgi:1,4-alpha-glucan branching enzyme